MTIESATRDTVRKRADFSCEFCGITETDAGGPLTIDHFKPKSKAGSDDLDNLLYCCSCCNSYKHDYWPANPDDSLLWNPRLEPRSQHFLDLDNGEVRPLTTVGAFTVHRLRLNRQPLVAHRLRRRQRIEDGFELGRYRNLVWVIGRLLKQQELLVEKQYELLQEQHILLQLLFDLRK